MFLIFLLFLPSLFKCDYQYSKNLLFSKLTNPSPIQQEYISKNDQLDILVSINTAKLIAQSKMRPDCQDLSFIYQDEVICHYVESACNEEVTSVWIRFENAGYSILSKNEITVKMLYGWENVIDEDGHRCVHEFSGLLYSFFYFALEKGEGLADCSNRTGWENIDLDFQSDVDYVLVEPYTVEETVCETGENHVHQYVRMNATSNLSEAFLLKGSEKIDADHTHETLTIEAGEVEVLPPFVKATLCQSNQFRISESLVTVGVRENLVVEDGWRYFSEAEDRYLIHFTQSRENETEILGGTFWHNHECSSEDTGSMKILRKGDVDEIISTFSIYTDSNGTIKKTSGENFDILNYSNPLCVSGKHKHWANIDKNCLQSTYFDPPHQKVPFLYREREITENDVILNNQEFLIMFDGSSIPPIGYTVATNLFNISNNDSPLLLKGASFFSKERNGKSKTHDHEFKESLANGEDSRLDLFGLNDYNLTLMEVKRGAPVPKPPMICQDLNHIHYLEKLYDNPQLVKNMEKEISYNRMRTQFLLRISNVFYLKEVEKEQQLWWKCNGIENENEDVCNGKGTCNETDLCVCENDKTVGNNCDEEIIGPAVITLNEEKERKLELSWVVKKTILDNYLEGKMRENEVISEDEGFNCSFIVHNLDDFKLSDIKTKKCKFEIGNQSVETKYFTMDINEYYIPDKIVVKVLTGSQMYEFETEIEESDLGYFFGNFWWIFPLAGVAAFLICVIIVTVSVVLFVLLIMQCVRYKKFKGIEDIDILLEEKQMEDQQISINPIIKINKNLFTIKYEEIKILKFLGKGGSGSEVFLANWKTQKVAYKRFRANNTLTDLEAARECERELNVLNSINHPFILQFFGACLKQPHIGLVIEYCPNGDLVSFCRKYRKKEKKNYPLSEKIRILMEISSAMLYVHGLNMYHRDIKPENVLVSKREVSKLMDFGLAKVYENDGDTKTTRVGTSLYMAPEISMGKDWYNNKCDVFSFGMLISTFVTENWNILGKDYYEIDIKLASDPSFRPKIDEKIFMGEIWLKKLMENCYEHEADDRPSFAEINKQIRSNFVPREIENDEIDEDPEVKKMLKEIEGIKKDLRELVQKDRELDKTIISINEKIEEKENNENNIVKSEELNENIPKENDNKEESDNESD